MVRLDHNFFEHSKKKNIGILGGTFDPAHDGHIKISMQAINRLKLNEVWWIISLSNPFKKDKKITSYSQRYLTAKNYVKDRRIVVSNLEQKINSTYSCDLIEYLKNKYPNKRFVWILGVDNLKHFHKWKNWKQIFYQLPIAIFDRPNYSLNVINSKCTNIFKKNRILNLDTGKFKYCKAPCWLFLTGWVKQISSSGLRNKLKN